MSRSCCPPACHDGSPAPSEAASPGCAPPAIHPWSWPSAPACIAWTGNGGPARLVLANLLDETESDVGRDGGGTWPAVAAPAGDGTTPATVRPVVVAVRSRRRAARARMARLGAGRMIGVPRSTHAVAPRRGAAGRSSLAAPAQVPVALPPLRALAAVGLVLVLAGAYVAPAAAGRAAPASSLAVDVSASVRRAGLDAAARSAAARSPRRSGRHDVVGAIAFADGATVLAAPSPEVPAAAVLAAAADGARSRRQRPRRRAPAGLAPSAPTACSPPCCSFSDGQRDARHALAEAAFAEPPLPVFPVTLDAAALPPAVIRRILAPPSAPDRTVVPLEAVVESTLPAPVEAALVVVPDGGAPEEVPATLLPGLTVVALPYRARGTGRARARGRRCVCRADGPAAARRRARRRSRSRPRPTCWSRPSARRRWSAPRSPSAA